MASKSAPLLLIVLIQMLVSFGIAQAQVILPPPVYVPGLPKIPQYPGAPLPGILPEVLEASISELPVPGIPRVPIPEIPGIPGLPVPGTPGAQIPTIPRVPIPIIPGVSGPPEIQECWASIINIGGCYAEIFRALGSGQAGYTVGSTCCKAVKDLSSTCWPRMLPSNPLFLPQLQSYCSRYTNPLPAVPPTTGVPTAPVAPAPEDYSPVAPAPGEDAPAPEAEITSL